MHEITKKPNDIDYKYVIMKPEFDEWLACNKNWLRLLPSNFRSGTRSWTTSLGETLDFFLEMNKYCVNFDGSTFESVEEYLIRDLKKGFWYIGFDNNSEPIYIESISEIKYSETNPEEITLSYKGHVLLKYNLFTGVKCINELTSNGLIEWIKNKYPLGTKFIPAHASTGYCIITEDTCIVTKYDGEITACIPEGNYDSTGNPKYGNTNYNRVLWYNGKWADIILDYDEKNEEPSKPPVIEDTIKEPLVINNGPVSSVVDEYWEDSFEQKLSGTTYTTNTTNTSSQQKFYWDGGYAEVPKEKSEDKKEFSFDTPVTVKKFKKTNKLITV